MLVREVRLAFGHLVVRFIQLISRVADSLDRVASRSAISCPWGANAGLGSLNFTEAWAAILKVWASQWGERAWLSRRAMGLTESQLQMSVLLQKVCMCCSLHAPFHALLISST